MAKGDKCRISNCKNIITKGRKGLICGTHQYRKRIFNSYDLPNHIGEPSFFVIPPSLPKGIVKICEKHGELTENNVYFRKYKGNISSIYCKKCTIANNVYKKFKGMTDEEYQRLLIKQNHVCSICNNPETTKRQGIVKKMAIDHCHKTGKIRGLLCQFCNSGIGYFKDSPELLQSAIEYLHSHE